MMNEDQITTEDIYFDDFFAVSQAIEDGEIAKGE